MRQMDNHAKPSVRKSKKLTTEQIQFINEVYIERNRRNPIALYRRSKVHDYVNSLMDKYKKKYGTLRPTEAQGTNSQATTTATGSGEPVLSSTQKPEVDRDNSNLRLLWAQLQGLQSEN